MSAEQWALFAGAEPLEEQEAPEPAQSLSAAKRDLAAHVCDWLTHFLRGQAVSEAEWVAFARTPGAEAAADERAWARFRASLVTHGVPHQAPEALAHDQLRARIVLPPREAQQWADGNTQDPDDQPGEPMQLSFLSMLPPDTDSGQREANKAPAGGTRQVKRLRGILEEIAQACDYGAAGLCKLSRSGALAREWLRCAARGDPFSPGRAAEVDELTREVLPPLQRQEALQALTEDLATVRPVGCLIPDWLGVRVERGCVSREHAAALLKRIQRAPPSAD